MRLVGPLQVWLSEVMRKLPMSPHYNYQPMKHVAYLNVIRTPIPSFFLFASKRLKLK